MLAEAGGNEVTSTDLRTIADALADKKDLRVFSLWNNTFSATTRETLSARLKAFSCSSVRGGWKRVAWSQKRALMYCRRLSSCRSRLVRSPVGSGLQGKIQPSVQQSVQRSLDHASKYGLHLVRAVLQRT